MFAQKNLTIRLQAVARLLHEHGRSVEIPDQTAGVVSARVRERLDDSRQNVRQTIPPEHRTESRFPGE